MIHLQNGQLSISIHPDGAELRSLKHHDREYLWSGDPVYWGKYSPVLFPIVGTVKGNRYTHDGQSYSLPRHGFAREKTFAVEQSGVNKARFTLSDDEATRAVYPFSFRFHLTYELQGARMILTYTVENPGEEDLFFCLGAHPAFAVPLAPGLVYEDYHLEFSEPETAGRWELEGGLLKTTPTPYLSGIIRIPLSKELFSRDAIVLKGLRSSTLVLASDKDPHGVRFSIEGWPHLGLWAAPGADFLCIEPWQGHADHVDDDPDIRQKEGVVLVEPGRHWSKAWWVELF